MDLLKNIPALIMAVIMAVSGCAEAPAAGTTAPSAPQTAVSDSAKLPDKKGTEGFYVSGTKLLDANGQEFIMRGINHAHTWYKDKSAAAIPAIAATGANCVRIVLANGIQWTKDDESSVKELIGSCKENKLIAILEVHDGTGSDDPAVLGQIANYWIEIKDALIGSEAYVILNIANEWFGSWGKDKQWADAYIDVIPRLRAAGIKNTIMVDSAGWGQYGASVAKEGERILASDTLGNTMFSIHMYGSAGGSKGSIKKNIDDALGRGLCLCIGEFGYNHSDGDVKEDYIMEYCEETGTGYLGWSWKGNSGGVEYLDISGDWEGKELSPDWGEILINGKNGISDTSKICSVFR